MNQTCPVHGGQTLTGSLFSQQAVARISGELRLIEVKGLGAASGTILLTPNERRVAEDRRGCYWLYVVTNCSTQPTLQEPVRDPASFPWHEVSKVQHYWLAVDALNGQTEVRETPPLYGDAKS